MILQDKNVLIINKKQEKNAAYEKQMLPWQILEDQAHYYLFEHLWHAWDIQQDKLFPRQQQHQYVSEGDSDDILVQHCELEPMKKKPNYKTIHNVFKQKDNY